MQDKHLRDFVAVVESGSVRAGAKLRGVTPAAISRNLALLERACGVALLERSNHGVELTEAGRVLLKRARVVEAEIRKAEEEMAALSGSRETRVTIAVSNVAEILLLPRALEKFQPRFPEARVRIIGASYSDALAMLRESRIDFLVGVDDPRSASDELATERLMSLDLVVTARRGHPMIEARTLAPLADFEWLLAGRHAEQMIADAFATQGLAPPVARIERGSILGMVHLLLNSDRVSLACRPTIDVFCDAGRLAVVPLDMELAPLVQSLTTMRRRPLTLAASALATEFVRASRGFRR